MSCSGAFLPIDVEDSLSEEIEAGATRHGALDQLETVDLFLDRSVAPELREGRVHGVLIVTQPGDEAVEDRVDDRG